MSEEVNILIEATDNASTVIEGAASSIDESIQQIEVSSTSLGENFSEAQSQMQESMIETQSETTNLTNVMSEAQDQQSEINSEYARSTSNLNNNTTSLRDNVMGMNSLALSGATLYMSFNRVENAQVSLDRANLSVEKSTNAVQKAHEALEAAIKKYGPDSQQAIDATNKFAAAQDTLTVAHERVGVAQRNFDDALIFSSLTVIPSILTVADKAITMYKNWASAAQEAATASEAASAAQGIGGGISAGTLAAGAGAAALVGTSTALATGQAQKTTSNPLLQANYVGSMATGGGIGVAIGQTLMNALGIKPKNAAQAKALGVPYAAEGAIVNEPTYVLVGEEGPEAVIPLNRNFGDALGDISGGSVSTSILSNNTSNNQTQNVTVHMNSNPTISIAQLSSNASLSDIISGIARAVRDGSAQVLTDALNQGLAEKQARLM